MLIGGFQPVTLLDYPQKLAAIIFTSGCNMRCPFCYNFKLVFPELITKESLYDEKQIINFLKKRKKYLNGLVITGGEPTLQPDLPDFLVKMKRIGYDIKLDTNGLWPDVLKKLLDDNLIDYIAMDIKGPVEDYEKFSGVKAGRIEKSIDLIMKSGVDYEFRSTVIKNWHNLDNLKKMAKMIKGAKIYYLQNYREEKPLAGDNFKGQPFSSRELETLRNIASQFVKNTLIRN